jgi:hypothetical protein
MRAEDFTTEALELTGKCLTLSPDHYTIFNYRRKILQALIAEKETPEEKMTLVSTEL